MRTWSRPPSRGSARSSAGIDGAGWRVAVHVLIKLMPELVLATSAVKRAHPIPVWPRRPLEMPPPPRKP